MKRTGIRVANFTSSKIYQLMTNGKAAGTLGKPALSYIEEKYFEELLGRTIDTETNARPIAWGKLVEQRAFDILGTEYKIVSTDTLQHPTIKRWKGSPDLEKYDEGKTVCDIKCPITPLSFCRFYECADVDEVRENHPDGEKYYWQLVSNAILTGARFAELIVYMPFKTELEHIREMANTYDGDQNKMAWINWATDDDLPYLMEGGFYSNRKVIRFEVSEVDKMALTARVNMAAAELERRLASKVMMASYDNEVGAVIVESETNSSY